MHPWSAGIRQAFSREKEETVPYSPKVLFHPNTTALSSRKAKVYVETQFADAFENGSKFIVKLASASEVEVGSSFEIDGAVTAVTADAKLYIPMAELVDKEAELKRLNKELESVRKLLMQDEAKLSNPGFMAKAPEKVIEKIRSQRDREQEKVAMIEAAIAELQ